MKKYSFFKYVTNPYFAKGLWTGASLTVAIVCIGKFADKRAKRKLDEDNELLFQHGKPTVEKANEDIFKLDRGREIMKYGIPETGHMIRYYSNHVLVYDQQRRTPIWVAEHLTPDNLKGAANRKHAMFCPDPGIDVMFSAQNGDYWKSGWSRGHMAPAGNNKMSQTAMQDSFYLSNIVPQNYENNAGFWNRMEMYCRDLTKTFSNVYIISGPLMLPRKQEDGKKIVQYQVIGENDVAVPTHLFKVIIVEDKNKHTKAIGSFVVPNEPIGFEHDLKEFQVDLNDLEKSLGVKLVPNLNYKAVPNLCKVDGCNLIGRNEFELYFIGRKMESANTLHRLDVVWKELEEKKLKPDKYLKELRKKKLEELGDKEKASAST